MNIFDLMQKEVNKFALKVFRLFQIHVLSEAWPRDRSGQAHTRASD